MGIPLPLAWLAWTVAAYAGQGNALPAGLSKDQQYMYCLAYQQAEYEPTDPVAEDCIWRIATFGIMRRLRLAFSGRLQDWVSELEVEQRQAQRMYPELAERYPASGQLRPGTRPLFDSRWMESHDPPIDLDAAERMLAQVVFEEARASLPPVEGEPIRWSRRFHRRHPGPKGTRLLVTLSFGKTSYLLRSGHEEELLAWIAAQPDRSITLESMFRTAYRAAGGDLSLALLTTENVLSRHFLEPDRNRLELAQRLGPIIDTFDDRGDHFGAWYHLWGMVLYTYQHGSVAGQVAASAETFGSHVSNPPDVVEPQEDFINQAGVRLGTFLRRLVRRERWRDHRDDPSALRTELYMDLDGYPVYRSTDPASGRQR